MNIPPNTKSFSLDDAISGHPLITRAGQPVKFIAYVPDVIAHHRVVVNINDEVYTYPQDGVNHHGNTRWDLFLAPLGYCQGLPVFAGDKLIGPCGDITAEPYMTQQGAFELAKWPSKAPVVETRINHDDMCSIYYNGSPVNGYKEETLGWYRIANKAIERAIADGDCIPTGCFINLAGAAFDKWVSRQAVGETFRYILDKEFKQYLEGLK